MAMQPDEFYKAANLKGNPFRPNPVHGIDPRISIWVGYEKQRVQLIKFLTRSRADQVGNINFIMLYGDFGTGKSHALLWAMNEITNRRKVEFDSVAYYIPTIKKEKGAFRSAAIEFVGSILDNEQNRADPQGPRGFFPFESDAIDAIASALVKITPRKIIDIIQQVLEEVRLAGLNPTVKAADLPFLDEHGILDEVLGEGGLG